MRKTSGIINHLTEYLSFGKSERIAIITVLLIILILVSLPSLFNHLKKPVQINDPDFQHQITLFLQQDHMREEPGPKQFDFTNPDREIAGRKVSPFPFDPNTLDLQGWVRMGFTERQAAGILKFREKGGRFRKKEDLKKLYAVSDEVYTMLEPFIQIPDAGIAAEGYFPNNTEKTVIPAVVKEKYRAELNSADSAELVKVYGIGPATARRIIRYREKLGGYVGVEQLKEVQGVDSARYAMISEGVFVDATVVKPVEINKSSISQLRQHPYIDYYTAKAIVDYRIKKGAFNNPEELRDVPGVKGGVFQKLKPYISVDQ